MNGREVVVVVLVAASQALAQSPTPDATSGNEEVVGGEDAGVVDSPGLVDPDTRLVDSRTIEKRQRETREADERAEHLEELKAEEARRRFALDVDAAAGKSGECHRWADCATVAAALVSIRFRASERVTVGALLPIAVGSMPPVGLDMGSPAHTFGDFGKLALFATMELRPGPRTRLPVGVLIAVPAGFAVSSIGYGPVASHFPRVAAIRGFEDWELSPGGADIAVAPSVGLSHTLDHVDLSGSVRLPVALAGTDFKLGAVVSAQLMVSLVNRRRADVSIGLRAIGVLVAARQVWNDPRNPRFELDLASVALEPRIEARLGWFQLHGGFVIPVAYAWGHDTTARIFPESWGVRVGAGYRF